MVVLALAVISSLGVSTMGCDRGKSSLAEPIEEPMARSERLAQEILIVDTHVDVPYRLTEQAADISQSTDDGHFDYPRARAGGLNAPFMSIYVPARYQESGGARELADELIDMVEGFESAWPDKFAVAHSVADVRSQVEEGLISLPLGMENGAPIEAELGNLAHFHARGVRYITLTHAENNLICDSSYDEEKQWNGLSPFGRDVVAEMNRLGIIIDISHVSDQAFYQVLEITQAPVIASHSSCRRFTPEFERNMDDRMIRALADNGGVIQINFGSAFLTEESNVEALQMWDLVEEFVDESGHPEESPEVREFQKSYRAEHPPILADVSDVADHIDHVVGLVGVDHVGIGSDFDGVEESTPTGLRDVSYYPNLIRVLLERGYSDEEIAKIFGENTLRVWGEVEAIASEL